ncbi:MAG TPA: peptidylprolyl isomerase [Rhodobacteraceae bacterium]|nr:peptidylprolyl isomerase [Paracoccaceae bacterium]
MSKFTNILSGVLLAGAVAMPLAAQDVDADTVVATVNGTDITVGHLILLRETLPAQYQSLPDDVLYDAILDQAIQQTVLAQTVDETPRAVELKLENERRALLAGEAIGRVVAEGLTEEAIQAAYDEKYANAEPEKEFNASHILVETREEAEDLIAQLEGGADFAELAKEKSTGPSGPNGGSLGWFGKGMMVKPFEDAVLELEAGQISQPIETQFGWHVIKLNETRLKGAPELEEVRDELVAELQKAILEAELKKLTEAAEVVRPDVPGLGPEVLRDSSLIEN